MKLELTPQTVVFRNVKLDQVYKQNLVITNPGASPVQFNLKTGSPSRYTVTPRTANLGPGGKMTVSIRLCLNRFANRAKGLEGQKDVLQIKSDYFDQKSDIMFYLAPLSSEEESFATSTKEEKRPNLSRERLSKLQPSGKSKVGIVFFCTSNTMNLCPLM
jgi:hypothetical protein